MTKPSLESGNQRSQTFGTWVALVIVLAGPLVGLILWGLGIVLAPPRTGFTGLLYAALAFLGLPIWIVAAVARWIKGWQLLAALVVMVVVALVYLTAIGPWLPTGMTQCEPLDTTPPRVRYACFSTSSDDPGYRYDFALEGRVGWPVIRLVDRR